jgi:4-amino-4-deoxy-L-arabinose transferase-like glycosyltransferase
MMNRINNKIEKYQNYLFLILLLAFYAILDYQTILFLRPQGIHFIRQTDVLSFVANYFNNGFNFFQPQVFNLQSIEGKAVGEFPVLYYITALSYLLFGEHEFILRLLTMAIASTGFFCLFKLLNSLLHDLFYAITFSFLFISSTILLYYVNNFLPDASALGFTLIGWYFFFAYLKNEKKQSSLLATYIFFTLASLIKVTYFISPIAAIASILYSGFSNRTSIRKIVRNNFVLLLFFTISLVLVLGWNLYVIRYNMVYQDHYFLIHSTPIWSLSKTRIIEVWDFITHYWYSKYYFQSTIHFFVSIIFVGVFFKRKSERMLGILTFFLALGSMCYFVLFYAQFKDHDYYFIALIPAIIFLVMNAFITLRNKFPKWINSYITKALLLLLCVLSLNYAREKLIQRYKNTELLNGGIVTLLAETRNYIDSIGISDDAKFVVMTDATPNGGLYFINRPGWTLKDDSEASLLLLDSYINQGANYILFTDKKYVNTAITSYKVGENNGVLIYKLVKRN